MIRISPAQVALINSDHGRYIFRFDHNGLHVLAPSGVHAGTIGRTLAGFYIDGTGVVRTRKGRGVNRMNDWTKSAKKGGKGGKGGGCAV